MYVIVVVVDDPVILLCFSINPFIPLTRSKTMCPLITSKCTCIIAFNIALYIRILICGFGVCISNVPSMYYVCIICVTHKLTKPLTPIHRYGC